MKASSQTRSEGAKINDNKINNIRYADDTVVIADLEEQLQALVLTESAKGGLKINTS